VGLAVAGGAALALNGTRTEDRRPVARRDGAPGIVRATETAGVLSFGECVAQQPGSAKLGTKPCSSAHALALPYDVIESPDGRNVYVAATGSDSVAIFARAPSPRGEAGALTQIDCVSASGARPCAGGSGLRQPAGLALSHDGRSLYVTARGSDAVAIFARDVSRGAGGRPSGTFGTLRQIACVSSRGIGGCTRARALDQPMAVAVSPDDRSVYVASRGDDAVAVFERHADGTIIQLAGEAGCVSDRATAPVTLGCGQGQALDGAADLAFAPGDREGRFLYVAARRANGIAILSRDPAGGALSQAPAGAQACMTGDARGSCLVAGPGLAGTTSIAFSPDGANLYAAAYRSFAVTTFSHDAPGRLTFRGCISEGRERGRCTPGKALWYAHRVAVSPDGGNVYVSSRDSSALAIFSRSPSDRGGDPPGKLVQPTKPGGGFQPESCVSWRGEQWTGKVRKKKWCIASPALRWPYSLEVTRDGKNVIVVAHKTSAVTVLSRQSVTP
jgi:DNA-binding beta-propeller fold protein YncE